MGYTIARVDVGRQSVLNDLMSLDSHCFPGDEPQDFTAGEWWLCYHRGQAVGFCGMRPAYSWTKTGFFLRCGVHENHRGQGLQKRMIRVRVARARVLAWRYVITYTLDNPPSANSLMSQGFRAYWPREPYIDHAAVTYWRREIR